MSLNILFHFVSSLVFSSINVLCFCWSLFTDTFMKRKVKIDYSKHVVLITGCDSGFGELASHRLAKMGFRVFSGCMTPEGVQRLQGVVTEARICDVTKIEDIEKMTEHLELFITKHGCNLWGGKHM